MHPNKGVLHPMGLPFGPLRPSRLVRSRKTNTH